MIQVTTINHMLVLLWKHDEGISRRLQDLHVAVLSDSLVENKCGSARVGEVRNRRKLREPHDHVVKPAPRPCRSERSHPRLRVDIVPVLATDDLLSSFAHLVRVSFIRVCV